MAYLPLMGGKMKYLPIVGMKYCLRQHEIPLRGMKYLPAEGMNVASRRRCKNGFALRSGESKPRGFGHFGPKVPRPKES